MAKQIDRLIDSEEARLNLAFAANPRSRASGFMKFYKTAKRILDTHGGEQREYALQILCALTPHTASFTSNDFLVSISKFVANIYGKNEKSTQELKKNEEHRLKKHALTREGRNKNIQKKKKGNKEAGTSGAINGDPITPNEADAIFDETRKARNLSLQKKKESAKVSQAESTPSDNSLNEGDQNEVDKMKEKAMARKNKAAANVKRSLKSESTEAEKKEEKKEESDNSE